MTEPTNNIGYICKECSSERIKEWQNKNKDTPVNVNDFVKLRFEKNSKVEWMWVQINNILDNEYKGVLDNDPVVITNLKCGETVTFKREHICQHLTP